MGKCAVPNCDSGSYQARKRRKTLGLRQMTHFAAPKCDRRRSQWMEALGCKLLNNQTVCQLHFMENDIKKTDVTIMPDGTVHELPRIYWTLKADAIPISQHATMDCDNVYQNLPVVPTNESLNTSLVPANEVTDEVYEEKESIDHVDTEQRQPDVEPSGDTPSFTMNSLRELLDTCIVIESWAWTLRPSGVVFTLLDRSSLLPILHFEVATDLSVQVRTKNDLIIPLNDHVKSVTDVRAYLDSLKDFPICTGTGMENQRYDPHCLGILDTSELYLRRQRHERCLKCRRLRQKLQIRQRKQSQAAKKIQKKQKTINLIRKSYIRAKRKTTKLLSDVASLKRKCAEIEHDHLETVISDLPEAQKQTVRTRVEASRVKGRQGCRYSLEWIYECILMRIKNRNLYEHIRDRKILPLPCRVTLNRYIQRISSSAYGFQKPIFECLKVKGSRMETSNKRGTLLIDEMKLAEGISFNRQTLEFGGFVNLGQYTPQEKQSTRADHAMVMMFQPFRGQWVQALGCFLSKDSVTSRILHKLMLECIILLSNSGFHVDVVTMDGAQWNRGVWSILGIKNDQFSCEHPCSPEKRLWMVSDFPHLIKCFRNGFIGRTSFVTPDGTVKKSHWEAVLEHEQFMKPNLKIAHQLSPAHLNPVGYQKMNVPLAFQLFSLRVRVAMETYRTNGECVGLRDSEPTQKFAERVDKLIAAMMSRTPLDALRPSEDCPQRKAINDFREYLVEWNTISSIRDMPISPSTVNGLQVTLGATLELMESLKSQSNYDFLMTARLNQDALERFFGIMRGACGSNDHPDPQFFAQTFRLLCSYSLVKPPKGSNVEGTELLHVLMQRNDSLADAQKPRIEWQRKIDGLLEGDTADTSIEVTSQDHDYEGSSMNTWDDSMQDHTYDVCRTSPEVQAYIAGYVIRKMIRQLKCGNCIQSLKSRDDNEGYWRNKVIDLMNQFGGLIYPSENLFKLTEKLESTVLDVVGKFGIKIDTFHTVLERLSELRPLPMVGCSEHKEETTQKIIDFYLVMRGHFLAKSFNANNNENRVKTRRFRKNAKL